MTKKVIHTDKAPAAVGAYSQAVKAGDTIYISGQIAIDPETEGLINGAAEAQTRQILENLTAILKKAGCSLQDVVKAEVFLDDIDDFSYVNDVYAEYFDEEPPARSCIEAARLPKDAAVEISVIAVT